MLRYLIIGSIFLAVLILAPVIRDNMRHDACLDAGGRWDRAAKTCLGAP